MQHGFAAVLLLPVQWGIPIVSLGTVLGMVAGVIAGTVESIGDYEACGRISGASFPPVHAINRGIFVEGLGCVLAAIFGTGTGTTSLSQNIGAIGISKVGHPGIRLNYCRFRAVWQIRSGLRLYPCTNHWWNFLRRLCYSGWSGVGLSNLQDVDLNSSRNVFVIGFSIFSGLTISQWMESNNHEIQTGSTTVDEIIIILFQTGMFVSFLLGFILDNTIPGTLSERRITQHAENGVDYTTTNENLEQSYELPYITSFITRHEIFKRIPISPTYEAT